MWGRGARLQPAGPSIGAWPELLEVLPQNISDGAQTMHAMWVTSQRHKRQGQMCRGWKLGEGALLVGLLCYIPWLANVQGLEVGPWFGASSSAELRRKASVAPVAPRWLRPSVAGVSCNLVACMPHVTSFFFRMLRNMCLARGWQKVSGYCMLCSALHCMGCVTCVL